MSETSEVINKIIESFKKDKLVHEKVTYRPWGGFITFSQKAIYNTKLFLKTYFPEEKIDDLTLLSPKILIVEPKKRLSLQYHNRRAELWRVIQGPVKAVCDESLSPKTFKENELVDLPVKISHRLIGDDNNYGIVAEIWKHTDPKNMSDEDDIVRLEDDYGRK